MTARDGLVRISLAFMVVTAAVGCPSGTTSHSDGGSCETGLSVACTCDGGARGEQTCGTNAMFGACACGSVTDGPVDGGCSSASQCDDHVFCNGAEQCAPGAQGSDALVCVSGTPPCAAGLICDEGTHACRAGDASLDVARDPCDMDGDNHRAATVACGGDDCDDNDFFRHPQALEFCTGNLPDGRSAANHDEDCDPCTVYSSTIDRDGDQDRDGYPSHTCTNPWLTSSHPACGTRDEVTINDPAAGSQIGTVAGNDCNDDPAPVSPATCAASGDGGVDGGDASATDASSDVIDGTSAGTVTGRDIHPGQVEVCDGLDNNCDGHVDEGDPGGGGTCGTGLQGACSAGINHCRNGCIACVPNVMPVSEVCNALDDDCNGIVDDIAPTPCVTNDPRPYPPGAPCAMGHAQCLGGGMICERDVAPIPETCNNVDDDCDGIVDNGVAPSSCPARSNASPTCTAGVCAFRCSVGFADCDGGAANGCEVGLAGDVNNCGACGRTCPGGATATCSSSVCRCPGTNGAVCGGACRDLASDANNCGACGQRCASGGSCSNGACQCPGTMGRSCNGVCVDVANDVNNCGSCGRGCSPAGNGGGAICSNGGCVQTCPGGLTNCSGVCQPVGQACNNGQSGLCAAAGTYVCAGTGVTCNDPYVWPGTQSWGPGPSTCGGSTTTDSRCGGALASGCFLEYGPYTQLYSGTYTATFNVTVGGAPFGSTVYFDLDISSSAGVLGASGSFPQPSCAGGAAPNNCQFRVPFTVPPPTGSTCLTGVEFRVRFSSATVGGACGARATISIGNTTVDRM